MDAGRVVDQHVVEQWAAGIERRGTGSWQIGRIREGLAATGEGRVIPAEEVFTDIAGNHGWMRSRG